MQQLVYLDLDLQKLLEYVHMDENEDLYLLVLRQLIEQQTIRKEIISLFAKLNVSERAYVFLRNCDCKKQVLYLNISGQKNVKNGDLDRFVSLRGLDMSNCQQSAIGNGFLDSLASLEILNMSMCNQTTITSEFLKKVTNLRSLNMSYCN